MEESQIKQQAYFDRIAAEFDQHYAQEKGFGERVVDRVFRQGMAERWRYVTTQIDWREQTVLDVGCGPGRYVAALVGRGAAHVTGLDFAASMVELARRNLEAVGATDRCDLVVGDFLTTEFTRQYDAVLAMGYFDYILGPRALDEHFRRMWRLATRAVVASFPYRWSFKTLPRWAWLTLRRCPVQFYSRMDVEALLGRHGVTRRRLVRMSGTILVVAEKA